MDVVDPQLHAAKRGTRRGAIRIRRARRLRPPLLATGTVLRDACRCRRSSGCWSTSLMVGICRSEGEGRGLVVCGPASWRDALLRSGL